MESYGPASAHHNSLCWASIITLNFCKWKDPWPWISFGPTCLQCISLMSCSGSSPFKNPAYLGEMYTHMYTNLFTFISEVFGQPKVNYHSLKEFFLRHRVNARIEFPFYLVSYQILCQDPSPHPIFFWCPRVWAEPLSPARSRPPAPDLSSRLQAPAREEASTVSTPSAPAREPS